MKTLSRLLLIVFVFSMLACGPGAEKQDAEEIKNDVAVEEEVQKERDALIEEHQEVKEEPVYELQREEAPPKEEPVHELQREEAPPKE